MAGYRVNLTFYYNNNNNNNNNRYRLSGKAHAEVQNETVPFPAAIFASICNYLRLDLDWFAWKRTRRLPLQFDIHLEKCSKRISAKASL